MALCSQCGAPIQAVPVAGPPRRRTRAMAVNADFTAAELEYMRAVDRWRTRHRRIPDCCDQLAILIGLGYRKTTEPEN